MDQYTYSSLWVLGVPSLIILLALVGKYPDRSWGTARRPDLPGPRGLPLIGNMVLVFSHRDKMHGFLLKMEQIYGPLFTFTLPFWGRNIIINRPEWLEHVKKKDTVGYVKGDVVRDVFSQFPGPKTPVANDGTAWRSARRMMQPVFTVSSLNLHTTDAMSAIVPTILQLLVSAEKTGAIIDWSDLAGRIALTIFCKMALSLEIDLVQADVACLDGPNIMGDALWDLNEISNSRLFNPAWPLTQFVDGTWWRFRAAKTKLLRVIDDLIGARLSNPALYAGQSDFLNILLSNHSDDLPGVRDTLMTLLFAGRDSTQSTLTWAIYELSRSPKWSNALRKEASAVKKDRAIISYDEIDQYHVHLAVLYETLRLWPELPKNARMAMESDILPAIPAIGAPEIRISKGDFVLWSDYSMMRNDGVWGSDAQVFNPGRHLDAKGRFMKPDIPKFHGFGCGPRACPARQLSTYEFIAIISAIVTHHDLVPIDRSERQMVDAFTALMDGPFNITVFDREISHQ